MHNAYSVLRPAYAPYVLMAMEVLLVMYVQLVILEMDVLLAHQTTTLLHPIVLPAPMWVLTVHNALHPLSALPALLAIPEQLVLDAQQDMEEIIARHAQ